MLWVKVYCYPVIYLCRYLPTYFEKKSPASKVLVFRYGFDPYILKSALPQNKPLIFDVSYNDTVEVPGQGNMLLL